MAANRTTSIEAEILHSGKATNRTTSVEAEVLHSGAATNRVTSIAVEVLIQVQRIAFTDFNRVRYRTWEKPVRYTQRRRFAPLASVKPTFAYLLLAGT